MQSVPASGGAPAVAQLQGLDLVAILQNAGISLPQQAQNAAPDIEPEPSSSMQARIAGFPCSRFVLLTRGRGVLACMRPG